MGKISDLPNELLRYLFQNFSPKDLKSAVLVSRRWRHVGEDPVLWKWCFITIANIGDISKLSVGRIKHVQEISVSQLLNWQTEQLEELFQAALQLPKLKKMNRGLMDFRFMNSELLGKVFLKLEKLSLSGNTTTDDQRMAIFKAMPQNSCIKKVTLARIDLSTLELGTEVLAKALSSLQKLNLIRVSFSNNQAQALFKSISENNELIKFNAYALNVPSVQAEILGKALTNIEVVSLDRLEMSPHQAQCFFAEMGRNNRIKSFDSIEGDLSAAAPNLLAKGLSKLEKVSLSSNNFTNEQARALFAELSKNCKLKLLDLAFNNLSAADPDELANAVINIDEVAFDETELTTEQIAAVLRRVQENTKLKKLAIICHHMSEVEPNDVANAVINIEEVDFSNSYLSPEQITAVLTRIQANTKLKKLSIRGNCISEVEPAIISRVREIIDELDIDSGEEYDDSDEEDSLGGFFVNESDTELD